MADDDNHLPEHNDVHLDDGARYHVDDIHGDVPANDDEFLVFAGHHYECTDDNCTDAQHVVIHDAAEFAEFYVERPRWHEHNDTSVDLLVHDHDGRAIRHEHHRRPGSIHYVGATAWRPPPA